MITEESLKYSRLLLSRAEQGDAEAQYKLGCVYEDHKFDFFPERYVSPQDAKEKAEYWLNKAAEQDHWDAQVRLINLYFHKHDPVTEQYWSDRADKTWAKDHAHEFKSSGGSGCYIATAVYGSYDAPEVLCLRQFRDETLSLSILGRLFIRFYYFFSPTIAERLKNTRYINAVIRKILDIFVRKITKFKQRE